MTRLIAICLMALCCFGFSLRGQASDQPDPIHAFYPKLYGDWVGTYNLWLRPGEEGHQSDFTAQIHPMANGAFSLMTYSWQWKDKPQAGVFLFSGKGEKAIANWGDSWHQNPLTLLGEGPLTEDGQKITLLGSYGAGSGPDWGWRTEFTIIGPHKIMMEAYNITPKGQEVLAVRVEMTRKK